MGYYEDLLKQRELESKNLLDLEPNRIEQGISKSRDLMKSTREGDANDTAQILSRISSRYGLPVQTAAGNEAFKAKAPAVDRDRESILSFRRSKETSQHYLNLYNSALAQYRAANYSLKEASRYAREYATQKTNQQFQGEQSQKQRDYITSRNQVTQEFTDKTDGINPDLGDPVQEAMIRSITGLLPYAYLAYDRRTK